jgi:hypothetical protein
VTSVTSLQTIQQNFATLSAPAPAKSPTGSADLFARLLALQSVAPTATPTAGKTGTTGVDIATTAQKYLGVPYVFGGEDASGIDCSGLVQRTLADLGIDAPRLVSGQSTIGTEVPSKDQVQPGDLIVLDGGEHIVIAIGDGKVIHAPEPGRNVQIADMWFDDSDIVTIRRVGAPAVAETPMPTIDDSMIAALLGSLGSLGGGASDDSVASSLNQLIAAQAALLARSAL